VVFPYSYERDNSVLYAFTYAFSSMLGLILQINMIFHHAIHIKTNLKLTEANLGYGTGA
jgi:hypothetical protein